MERYLTELEARPQDREQLVGEIFRAVHTIKGATGFLGFSRLEKLAHAGEHVLGSLRDGRLPVRARLVDRLLRLHDGLRAILVLIEETGGEGTRAGDEDGALIAELDGLDGEVPDAEVCSEEMPEGTVRISGETKVRSPSGKTLRVDVEVLNRMMNLVEELVSARSGMQGSREPEMARLDRIATDLHATVMQACMRPVGDLFDKFPRMVRDLARTCGRDVRIEFFGGETSLDKSLMEAIRGPLTHAVRNALSHGIESPAERLRAGKSAVGSLRLKAYQRRDAVVIEVCDDGAGIVIERVLAKAIEFGLVTREQAGKMSEREALQLIFLPGFSTAEAVTTVSGRGVGMDVIRADVERVGGGVEIESRIGVGTTVRLCVPLTRAIVPALIVRSGDRSFALPQSELGELAYISAQEAKRSVERIGACEVYRLRNDLLPVARLDRLLGLESSMESHGFYIAVLEAEGVYYGLAVDDLVGSEEVVLKPASALLRGMDLFAGVVVLSDGTQAPMLDAAAIAARAGVKAMTGMHSRRTVLPLGAVGLHADETAATATNGDDPHRSFSRIGARSVAGVTEKSATEKYAASEEMDPARMQEELTTVFRGLGIEVDGRWREVA